MATVVKVARPGEEAAAKLVEGHRHDPVRCQESLLHAISVVNVDVHIKHPCMVLQQLQDGQHYVVHIAKARGLHVMVVPFLKLLEG